MKASNTDIVSQVLIAFAKVVPDCFGAGASRDKSFSIKPVDFLYFLAVFGKGIKII